MPDLSKQTGKKLLQNHSELCPERSRRRSEAISLHHSLFLVLPSGMAKPRHSIFTTTFFFLLLLFLIASPAYAKYGGGTGEPNDPYLIYDANQMNAIGIFANLRDWGKHFRLMADIDLSGYTRTAFNIIPTFSGVFDGSGHTISDFTYTSTKRNNIGLFGYVRGIIKDLGLIDPKVDAGTKSLDVGSLVGRLDNGTITNCYAEGGSVSGYFFVGGLVGANRKGTITNSYSTGSVAGNKRVGGLVGHNYVGAVTNCYSTGSVSGNYEVGGLVGVSHGTITNSYATGSVTGKVLVGGLVGWNSSLGQAVGTITNSYSEGDVSGKWLIGGLVGKNEAGEITDSFWDTETSGQTTSAGGTGKTTAEMQRMSTFTNVGWDFTTPVWTIDEGTDYPRLWWELAPVLHVEPEVTLGTSNTISWDPVPGANDYYAECAKDANFTSIVYASGWITETSFEFTGLQLGRRYWYSVKARNIAGVETNWSNVESSLQATPADAVEVMLDPDSLKNKSMKNALLNKINAAQQMLDVGRYEKALNKLENDILQKTNGCAETGEPDKND